MGYSYRFLSSMPSAHDLPATDLERVVGAALELALSRLGPATERVIAAADVQALLLSRMRAGVDLEDTVLAGAHRAARTDSARGGRVRGLLPRRPPADGGGASISPNLRRYLDTGDLVQPVLGDLWPELAGVRFETRGRFLAYMSRRLAWKAAGKARKLGADRRREDLRAGIDVEALGVASDDASPASRAAANASRTRRFRP